MRPNLTTKSALTGHARRALAGCRAPSRATPSPPPRRGCNRVDRRPPSRRRARRMPGMESMASAGREPAGLASSAPGGSARARTLSVLPALLVGLIATLQLGLYLAAFAALSPQELRSRDFSASYVAGTLLKHGEAAHLYDPAAQMEVRRQVEQSAAPHPLPFVYPPSAAAAVLPLTVLPVGAADRIWSLVQLASLALAAWLVARAAPWPWAGRPPRLRSAAGCRPVRARWSWRRCWPRLPEPGRRSCSCRASQPASWRWGWRWPTRPGRAATTAAPHSRSSLAFPAFKPHLAIGLVVFVLALRNRRAALGLVAGGSSPLQRCRWRWRAQPGCAAFSPRPASSSDVSPVQTMSVSGG